MRHKVQKLREDVRVINEEIYEGKKKKKKTVMTIEEVRETIKFNNAEILKITEDSLKNSIRIVELDKEKEQIEQELQTYLNMKIGK